MERALWEEDDLQVIRDRSVKESDEENEQPSPVWEQVDDSKVVAGRATDA